MGDSGYMVVSADAMPEIYKKVLEAKRYIQSGKLQTVSEAVSRVGISRSAFYKYKDLVLPFDEPGFGRTITFAMNLDDEPGLLSNVLTTVANSGSNILTINQTIPINKIANVTITLKTKQAECENSAGDLFETIKRIRGVLSLIILAQQ